MVSMVSTQSFFWLVAATAAIAFAVIALIAFGTQQQHCSMDPVVPIPYNYSYSPTPTNDASSWSIATCEVFSETYETARQKFRAAVQALPPNLDHRFVTLPIPFDDANDDADANAAANDDDQNAGNRYTIDVVILPGNNCRHDHDHYDKDSSDEKRNNSSNSSSSSSSGIVIHVSGTHGIEGFAGSAIQIGYLRGLSQPEPETTTTRCGGTATVVLVHAFNPYGMHHYRRVNEHNVDLNRNGLVTKEDWDLVLNGNHYNTKNYDTLVTQHLLSSSIGTDRNHSRPQDRTVSPWGIRYNSWDTAGMERYVWSWTRMTVALLRYGIPTLKAALVGGQYHVPDGLFYGGGGCGGGGGPHTTEDPVQRNEPSLTVVREWLETFLTNRRYSRNVEVDDECVTWIDVHTGLGPSGLDTLLFGQTASRRPPDVRHLKHWFPRSLLSSSSSSSAVNDNNKVNRNTNADAVQLGYERVVGFTMDYYYTTLFDKYYNNSHNLFMAQEFGTVPSVLTGRALIVEHLLYNYYKDSPNVPVTTNTTEMLMQSSKEVLGAAFYPQRTEWRRQILQRGLHTLQQAIQRSSYYSRDHIQENSVSNVNHQASESTEESSTRPIPTNRMDDTVKVEF